MTFGIADLSRFAFFIFADYCFMGTMVGKPLLRCLKAGSGDDALHHGVDFIFSHGLYFVPTFVVGLPVVLYREIKWTTRPGTKLGDGRWL